MVASQIEFHPAACLFPEFSPEEYADLRDDIAEYGQRVSIKLLDGKVLDGRAVLRACQELRIEPKFEAVTLNEIGDPYEYVFSLNLQRRHLTASQRAMMAHKARELKNSPVSKLAARFDVSPRYVEMAAEVKRQGDPELQPLVESGEVSLPTARDISRLPKPEQREKVQRIKSGDIASVRAEFPKPERNRIADQRPAEAVDPKAVFLDAFDNLDGCRFECLLAAFNQLSEGEQAVFAERIGAIMSPAVVPGFPAIEFESTAEIATETDSVDRGVLSDELIDSPQMLALSAALKETKATAIGTVALLYKFAAKSAPAGDIGRHGDLIIKGACDWKHGEEFLVSALVDSGWLVRDREHRLLIVDWENRCPAEAIARLAETGDSFAEPTGTVEESGKAKKRSSGGKSGPFVPPTLEEVKAYCLEKKSTVDPEHFFAHYEANGWVQGKGKPIKKWQLAIVTWEKMDANRNKPAPSQEPKSYPKPTPLPGYGDWRKTASTNGSAK